MIKKTVAALTITVLFAGGCGATTPSPEIQAAFDEKIAPIIIQAGRSAPISDPKLKAVVYVGSFLLEKYLKLKSERTFEADGDTVLTIRETVDGKPMVTVLRIKTGRKLRITMDGKFVADIEKDRVELTAEPGSTILVTDASAEDVVHQYGSFQVPAEHTHIDLDTGRTSTGEPAADVASAGVLRGGLKVVNGALLARWDGGQPSRKGCTELPADMWELDKTDFIALADATYCVRTNENRYGIFHIGTGPPFKYIVWKNPPKKS